jgi:hypothetical protein
MDIMAHGCHPSYMGGIGRRMTVQASPGKIYAIKWKLTKAKKAWGVAQVEEYLLSKLIALSSNPVPHTHIHTCTRERLQSFRAEHLDRWWCYEWKWERPGEKQFMVGDKVWGQVWTSSVCDDFHPTERSSSWLDLQLWNPGKMSWLTIRT